jgi:hypothetical protein
MSLAILSSKLARTGARNGFAALGLLLGNAAARGFTTRTPATEPAARATVIVDNAIMAMRATLRVSELRPEVSPSRDLPMEAEAWQMRADLLSVTDVMTDLRNGRVSIAACLQLPAGANAEQVDYPTAVKNLVGLAHRLNAKVSGTISPS